MPFMHGVKANKRFRTAENALFIAEAIMPLLYLL